MSLSLHVLLLTFVSDMAMGYLSPSSGLAGVPQCTGHGSRSQDPGPEHEGVQSALWETRPASPSTALVSFESNFRGSRPRCYLVVHAFRFLLVQFTPRKCVSESLIMSFNLLSVQSP